VRNDTGVFVAAVLAWAGFAYKLHHLRRRAREPGALALRALVVVLGLMACMFTLLPRTVAAPIDALLGLSGVVRLITNMLAMVTCLAVLGWLLYLSRQGDEARARLVLHARILALFLAGVLVLFAFDHPPVTPDREFAGAHMHLFLIYVGYVEVRLVALSWRYASMVDEPLLRLGQRIVAGAIVLGVLFLVTELVYLIESDLGRDFYGSPAIGRPLYTAASILFVVGLTLPAWGPRLGLDAVLWRVTRWCATRRLRPLWKTVTEVCPGVVLDRAFLAASPYGERIAAERLLVEVHDGWLQLRSYLTPADAELIHQLAQRHGIRACDASARVAAARLMLAIRRKRAADGPPPGAVPPVEHLGAEASKTLLAEVRFLCDVSRNLRSRFVSDVLALVAADPAVALQHGAGPH